LNTSFKQVDTCNGKVMYKKSSPIRRLKAHGLAGVVVLTSLTAAAQTTPAFDTLQRQVTDGQFEAAYKLGKTMPGVQGDPHFDFLFGVAAINVGRVPEGVLALERHLAAVPGNDRARLDLARGYFELGDYVRARSEFEFVLRYNPPKDVRSNIERYLDAMQTRDAFANKASSQLYLELGAGRDSNVNAGTYNSQITLPTGPVVLADNTSRAAASNTYTIAGAGQWVRRVTPAFAVFGGGDFSQKSNVSASAFDTFNASVNAGFSVVSGSILYKLTMADAVMFVDKARYRGALSATGEAQYGYGDGLMFNGVLQYAEQAYSASNSIRDSKTLTYGAGLQKLFTGAWRPALGFQVSRTEEQNLNQRDDLNRSTTTVQMSMAFNPTDQLGLSLGVARQHSGFDAADIAFATVRSDKLWSVDLSANYALSRHWVVRGEVQWSENSSNQDLYAFKRTYSLLKARYLF
jgi:tetratricopeptide (TPR) repeat protein